MDGEFRPEDRSESAYPATAEAVAPVYRRVRAISIAGVEPRRAETADPVLEWVDPAALLVNDAYQRELGENSVRLIRRIVADWDWRRFKPPVVARTPEGLMVIDGQHTAIAAVSHPLVYDIPVLIVQADAQADQAAAFLGHNRDRVAMTRTQMHVAAVAAGDAEALVMARLCAALGVRILKNPPTHGQFRARDCMAVGTLQSVIRRRGADKAAVILKICAEAEWAPVTADLIKAIDCLCCDKEYAELAAAAITGALLSLGQPAAEQQAALFAAAHDVPKWRGLAIILSKKARRGR